MSAAATVAPGVARAGAAVLRGANLDVGSISAAGGKA